MSQRELDFIIYGASGFTGKYTVFEAVKILKDYRWGVAGRSKDKLEKVLEEMGTKSGEDLSKTPIIIADINDEESLKNMAAKCKVVINCVGPYRLWGEPVVKACIEAGTHQVDVTGEPQYMERMVLEYNDKAKEKNSFIVSACGFDSIPADMGVVFLEKHFEGVVNSVESYLELGATSKVSGPSINYGTWASLVHGVSHWKELAALRKKLYPERLPKFEPILKDKGVLHKSPINDRWSIPFLGADKSVVYRSQRYFYEKEKKRPIQIKTYQTPKSLMELAGLFIFGLILAIMTRFKFGQKLLLDYPALFSFGAVGKGDLPEENTVNTKFTLHLKGKGWTEKLAEPTDSYSTKPDKEIYVKVKGKNVGYGATCIALLTAAKTLVTEADKLPKEAGVFTPGMAFAKTNLVSELCKNGVTFEVIGATEEQKE